ncbi:MAG: hypothetical protein ABIU54_00520 [Candidatus Eisenbacteria bacterium]
MSSADDTPLLRHAPATVQGRYRIRPVRASPAKHHWIGFHGQAQTAEAVLDAFAASVPTDDWLVVSVQALNLFYAGRNRDVVAGWMTRLDRELAITSNLAYVDTVVEQVQREFGTPECRILAGFSQGVAMAYRAGVLGRHRCDAIVTVGGDVPPELAALPPRPWPKVLAMTGRHDAYFPPEALERDVESLRTRGIDARALVFEGGHEWAAGAEAAAAALLHDLTERPGT